MGLPYAFAPGKHKSNQARYLIMPYAFGIDYNGKPDAEARVRLDEALARATSKSRDFDVMIFLGAGMPEHTRPYDVKSLAASGAAYLQEIGRAHV